MKLPQIILVSLALGAGAYLYFTPYAPLAKQAEEAETSAVGTAYDIREDITEIKNGLDSAALAQVNGLELALSEDDDAGNIAVLDNLIAFYDMLRKPVGSAYYSLKRAELSNGQDHWTEAGERFLLNAKYMGDKDGRESWFAQSRACYEKAVELVPKDLDLKVDLAVSLIEGAFFLGTPPMEGIGMLKKVEQQDPDNIKALVNLGYFSIRSGQFGKAEERFNRVIEIDSDYADAYLYLAELHEKQKKIGQAITDLENFSSRTGDPIRAREVNSYIEELRKNI